MNLAYHKVIHILLLQKTQRWINIENMKKDKNPAAVALGSLSTKKKAIAARKNGKLGGRPRTKKD